MWISLHECRSKILGFTYLYAALLKVLGKDDNMIGVFDQVLIERQQLDPDVQCLYIYDSCSSMFCRRALWEYLYTNVHLLWHFCEQLSIVMTALFVVVDDSSLQSHRSVFQLIWQMFCIHVMSPLVCLKKFCSSCRSSQPLHSLCRLLCA